VFKVGDKVKCIKETGYYSDDFPPVIIGGIYTVEKIGNDGDSIVIKEKFSNVRDSQLVREFETNIFELVEADESITPIFSIKVLQDMVKYNEDENKRIEADINQTLAQVEFMNKELEDSKKQIEELKNSIKILEKLNVSKSEKA
jgi:predicted RNase H-like nuclease (RuvC/YqgF family)